MQKSDELIADANWHGGIEETGETGDGARTIANFLGQLALHFQAGGTRPIRLRHQLAKRIFVSGAAHRGLPMLNGAQGDRHSRGVRKGARVIAINCGARQFLDQLLVAKLHQPQPYRFAAWLSKVSLGVAQAASDDPRIERDHRSGAKHN